MLMPTNAMRVSDAVAHSVQRYTRFVLVGVSNAVVDLFVLNMLLFLLPSRNTLEVTLYNSLAVGAAIVNSYAWNRQWTFADRSTGSSREKWLFVLQAAVNVAVNDVTLVGLTSSFDAWGAGHSLLVSNAAKGVAMFLSSSVSYLLMRFFVFKGQSTR